MATYSSLLKAQPNKVAEPPHLYRCVTERHIQAAWLEQKYFKHLTTACGLPIKVISPGLWNAGAGPDFLKAHLEIGGKAVKGDIELHLNDAAWQHHNHHLDPRYNDVVLHVSLWLPLQARTMHTASQATFYKTYLEPSLTVPPNRLISLIDLELYPYKKFTGSGKCATLLFKSLSEQNTRGLFHEAARWRLAKKLERLKALTANPRLWLGIGIAAALGYKSNAETFQQLYLFFNQCHLQDKKAILAASLKATGFFSSAAQKKWNSCSYYAELLSSLPKDLDIPEMSVTQQQARPFNHPIRRLAYLAHLMADGAHYLLKEKLFSLWDDAWQQAKPARLRHLLMEALPAYQDAFFNRHYLFGCPIVSGNLALIGEGLKQSILVNAFLPLLSERIRQSNHTEEIRQFDLFYAAIPAESSSKSVYLQHRFFGDTPKKKVLSHADMEQGAYQLHHDFCLHYEASCEGCPFVERYKAHYPRA
jgi:hypothetical protein